MRCFRNPNVPDNLFVNLKKLNLCRSLNKNKLKQDIIMDLKDAGIDIEGLSEDNPLSFNERICLALSFMGQERKRIAMILGVDPESVKTYYRRIFQKLQARNRQEAICVAFANRYFCLTSEFYRVN